MRRGERLWNGIATDVETATWNADVLYRQWMFRPYEICIEVGTVICWNQTSEPLYCRLDTLSGESLPVGSPILPIETHSQNPKPFCWSLPSGIDSIGTSTAIYIYRFSESNSLNKSDSFHYSLVDSLVGAFLSRMGKSDCSLYPDLFQWNSCLFLFLYINISLYLSLCYLLVQYIYIYIYCT